jgi:cytochrome oxidase Cu insertion factor (SCO1/SenC/PrrC family)
MSRKTKPDRYTTKQRVGAAAGAAAIGVALLAITFTACTWNLETRTPQPPLEAQAPAFELSDQDGRTVTLEGLLADGPAVVVFYRGYW